MKVTPFGLAVSAAWLLGSGALLLGQNGQLDALEATPIDAVSPAPIDIAPAVSFASSDTPLTIRQKYEYSLGEIFSPGRVSLLFASAGLDQLRNHPREWGTQGTSYAVRFASHFGDDFLNHTLEFGIRALDHEDPRYKRSGHGPFWNRFGYALIHTFVARSDRGGWMPAYSIVAADIGTPYLVRRWQPYPFHTGETMEQVGLNFGSDIGNSFLREFWPDVKRKLPAWLRRSKLVQIIGD